MCCSVLQCVVASLLHLLANVLQFLVTSLLRRLVEVLQCAAVCCSVLQCVAVCSSVSQCVAASLLHLGDGVFQCVAVCSSVLQHVAICCSVLQCAAVCCSVLQCVAACCSVLQCVAGCRRVLQFVAVSVLRLRAGVLPGVLDRNESYHAYEWELCHTNGWTNRNAKWWVSLHTCVTWLIHAWGSFMCAWHVTLICETYSYVCDMVCSSWLVYGSWLIILPQMLFICVRYGSFICGTYSFVCVTWLIYMCVWRDSFICETSSYVRDMTHLEYITHIHGSWLIILPQMPRLAMRPLAARHLYDTNGM